MMIEWGDDAKTIEQNLRLANLFWYYFNTGIASMGSFNQWE